MEFQKSSKVATRKILDRTLLLPMSVENDNRLWVYELNEVGAFLWNQLDYSTDENVLAQKVSAEFETDLERALQDIQNFCKDLRELGALK